MTQPPVDGPWPDSLPAVQVRIARPTDQLDAVLDFYHGVLGLPATRTGGDGFEVAMVGLPGAQHHLEFVTRKGSTFGPAPNGEHMIVLYFTSAEQLERVRARLAAAGHGEVALDNPWWSDNGALAFTDPDDYRVVLMPTFVPLRGLQAAPAQG